MERRRKQILKKEEKDARLLDRCEAKRKKWTQHWQRDESVQNMNEGVTSFRLCAAVFGLFPKVKKEGVHHLFNE